MRLRPKAPPRPLHLFANEGRKLPGHVTELFHLLMKIERRHAAGNPRPKKAKKLKIAAPSHKALADKAEIGSLNRGPYFILDKIMYAVKQLHLILKSAYYNDRHYSFNSYARSF